MRRSDWLLLLLTTGTGEPMDPVRVQKGMFLLAMGEAVPPEETYTFEPYSYGPMSRALYRDMRMLRRHGCVAAIPVRGASWELLQATAAGARAAGDLRATAPPEGLAAVAAIRDEIVGMSFTQLLDAVYTRYPVYATRSVFRRAP